MACFLRLLAFVAWQSGDGALANVALDRALADNPRYSMTQLLRQVIAAGASPSLARLPLSPEEVAASYGKEAELSTVTTEALSPAVAQELSKLTGQEWTDREAWWTGQRKLVAGEAELLIQDAKQADRVAVHGDYPKTTMSLDGYRVEITVAKSRGPEAIAREIQRRGAAWLHGEPGQDPRLQPDRARAV